TSIWRGIRTGAWLTPTRLRHYAIMLVAAYGIATVVWIALGHGLIDRNNKPIGIDFANVYSAGKLALAGNPGLAYDGVSTIAVEKATFGTEDVPFYIWAYPPLFLGVAAALALMPYGLALAVWMAATLPAYWMAIIAIVPRAITPLVALLYPAVFVNLGHGQNGFIGAALLGAALLLLNQRPIISGVLFGLLAYKP